MSKVLIFGSGFDSLLAAHAAAVIGHDIHIISDEQLAEQEPGPDLLTCPIPVLDLDAARLMLAQTGDPDILMDKLLNQGGAGTEPVELHVEDGDMVFDSSEALRQLSAMYQQFVQVLPGGISHRNIKQILEHEQPDVVFSGLAKDEICGDRNHTFQAAAIVVMPLAKPQAPAQLILNGEADIPYAMDFNLFGRAGKVYGGHRHPPLSKDKLTGYALPQATNCDCFTGEIYGVGKMGAWKTRWKRHRSFYFPFATLDRA